MRGCGFVDDASATHQGTCRGQLFELPTARPFAHKLHSHLLRLKQRSQNPENQPQPTINARNTDPVTFTGITGHDRRNTHFELWFLVLPPAGADPGPFYRV